MSDPVARVIEVMVTSIIRWVVVPVVRDVDRRVRREVRRVRHELGVVDVVPVVTVIGVIGAAVVVDELESGRERDHDPRPECGGESEGVVAYQTLGFDVPPEPSDEAVRASYRTRVMETHPDQGGDVAQFVEVREAYEQVTSEELRPVGQNGGVTDESDEGRRR